MSDYRNHDETWTEGGLAAGATIIAVVMIAVLLCLAAEYLTGVN